MGEREMRRGNDYDGGLPSNGHTGTADDGEAERNNPLQRNEVGEDAAPPPTDEDNQMPQVNVDPTKDLWQNITLNTRDNVATQSEVNMLVVGSPGSGKTSVLHLICSSIGSSGNTSNKGKFKLKPTTALDYLYTMRSERHISQVAHFWELAHGTELSQLCEVVITPENVHMMLVMIVVDCSDPSTMWETLTYWLKRFDRRVIEISQKMRTKGSSTPDKLKSRAKRTVGLEHPDISRLRISGLPTIIVCNKLDAFVGDMSLLKSMVRSIRYIAHLYGAYLVFCSETESTKLRYLMSHLLFLTPFDMRLMELDPERGPVLVTPDADTFADIGNPSVTSMSDFQSTGDTELDRWKAPFDAMFPPKKSENGLQNDLFLKRLYDTSDGGFGEPTIDAVRKQKDEELEQYRKGSSKREKAAK